MCHNSSFDRLVQVASINPAINHFEMVCPEDRNSGRKTVGKQGRKLLLEFAKGNAKTPSYQHSRDQSRLNFESDARHTNLSAVADLDRIFSLLTDNGLQGKEAKGKAMVIDAPPYPRESALALGRA
jgi:hypothetical protein